MLSAYLRVTTEDQAESGLGIERQRAAVLAWCERGKLPAPVCFDDAGLSGTLPAAERPGLLKAIESVRDGGTLLIADRRALARGVELSVLIEHEIKRVGGRVVCVAEREDEDEYSRSLRRNMERVLDEAEVLRARLRTKSALAAKRARGEPMGRAPFGWRYEREGGPLEPDPALHPVLKWILELRASGLTAREIAKELECRHIPSPTGLATWSHATVAKILRRNPPSGSAVSAAS